jgi:hypothetical protein
MSKKKKAAPSTKKAARSSGGSRRSLAERRRREQLRGPTFEADYLTEYFAKVGSPPFDDLRAMHEWHARSLAFQIDGAARDPGLPVEARRQAIASLSSQLTKALQPAELAAELRAIVKALDKRSEAPAGAEGPDA